MNDDLELPPEDDDLKEDDDSFEPEPEVPRFAVVDIGASRNGNGLAVFFDPTEIAAVNAEIAEEYISVWLDSAGFPVDKGTDGAKPVWEPVTPAVRQNTRYDPAKFRTAFVTVTDVILKSGVSVPIVRRFDTESDVGAWVAGGFID